MAQVWKSGITSVSMGTAQAPARVEWLYADTEYPSGRYTLDQAQALTWAQQACDIANSRVESGAMDWQPAVWQEDIE